MRQQIAIVGAGLVGSLLSVWLAKRGFAVTVYERRSDIRKEAIYGGRSINLALSDRGWRVLNEVGLAEDFRQIAIPMRGRMVHAIDGQEMFQPYGEAHQAIFSVSRADLNKQLISAAEKNAGVQFLFNHRSLQFDHDDMELHLLDGDSSQHLVVRPELIFGADGAFSSIRGSMQRINRFNYSQEYLNHSYKELTLPPAPGGGWLLEKNALHIWPRKSFMLIALPNIDGSFTCTLFLAHDGEISFNMLSNRDAVKQFFETYFPDVPPLMPNLYDDFFANPTSSLVTIRCSPWTYNQKIALIGDAAHAVVPFYGQGMNAGFEDVRVLCELIDQYSKGQDTDWAQVFAQYETLRIPDGNAIADLALQNFIEMRDLVADPQFQLRKKMESYLHENYADFNSLYSLVTFSDKTRYSEAKKIGQRQDRLFNDILNRPNMTADTWQQPDMLAQIDELVKKYLADISS